MTLFSVVIPAFNAEAYLREAIDSVLSQNAGSLEILVVDDGSTDQTAAIAASYASAVVCISQSNQGIAAARNTAIRQAKGEFLCFLDADDLWLEDKLRKQVELLKTNPQIDAVYGHVVQFVSPELASVLPPISGEKMPGYVAGTLLLRRETFLKVGYYATHYVVGEAIEWHGRLALSGAKIHLMEDVLLKRRIHQNNTGVRQRQERRDYVLCLKKLLDDKRRLSGANLS